MKRIDASQLRVGMFVMKLGGSWLKHPFWRAQFQLSHQGQIDDIRKAGITEIWIDPERGEDVMSETLMPAPAPAPAPEPLTRRPWPRGRRSRQRRSRKSGSTPSS